MPSVVMYAPLVLLVGAMVLSEEPPGPCPVVEGTEAANHSEAPLGAGLPVWTFCLYVDFTSYWEMEPGINGLTAYRWIDGTPTVIRDERRNWDEERRCYDFRIRELREGVMVETVRYCFPELLPPGR